MQGIWLIFLSRGDRPLVYAHVLYTKTDGLRWFAAQFNRRDDMNGVPVYRESRRFIAASSITVQSYVNEIADYRN